MFKESSFRSIDGRNEDHFYLFEHQIENPEDGLKCLENEYRSLINKEHQTVWLRLFFHPDVDSSLVKSHMFLNELQESMSCSVIYQKPRQGCCALLVYVITKSSFAKNTKHFGSVSITELKGENLSQCWVSNISHSSSAGPDCFKQAFSQLKDLIIQNQYQLRDHLLRTWVYLKDLLGDYKEMVEVRKKFFERENITSDTIFPASTGVQGQNVFSPSRISIDAMLTKLKNPEQKKEIRSSKSMPTAYSYGVTFSRAVELLFSQKKYIYISGTASIDAHGNIIYDTLEQQCHQSVMNFMDILEQASMNINQLQYIIIYVKTGLSLQNGHEYISRHFPENLPIITVEADICRTGWLVELEGVAIKKVQLDMPAFS